MSTQFRRYDIIINGGGIVGFTLLNSLLKSSCFNRIKVLLIEQAKKPKNYNQPPRHKEEQSNSDWNSQADSDTSCNKQFSNRVSSITKSSRNALKDLTVWNSVEQYAKNVKTIKVWNYDYANKILFKQNQCNYQFEKDDRDVIFSVVENNRLSLALLNNIYNSGKADDVLLWNHTLEHLETSPDEGLVNIVAKGVETGEEITLCAPLILGCDGFKSKVREFSRMKYTEFSLNKTAVVGTVKINPSLSGQSDGNAVAYQRFSAEKDTVAALLPLDTEYSSFVISAPNDYAKHLQDCDEDTFISEFNLLLSQRENPDNVLLKGLHEITNSAYNGLHKLVDTSFLKCKQIESNLMDNDSDDVPTLDSLLEGSRATFPLMFGTTTPRMIASLPGKCHPQVALLGDSSHRVHPLAGQGLNLGIQDAVVLVKKFERMVKSGERVFNENDLTILSRVLKEYERERQCYIAPMSAGILSMTSLFKLLPTSMLTSVNKCDFIKSTSVRFANGC